MLTRNALFVLISFILITVALQAQEKAYPKSGEGVTLFLKRFNRSGNDYYDQFIQLNKHRLDKRQELRMGVKYELPPLKKNSPSSNRRAGDDHRNRPHYEPLFGKAMAAYSVSSSELKGATFYLVSGHGGPDPGAIGKMGKAELHEDEYAYDIMLRLARNLMTRGAHVEIIIQDAVDGIRNEAILKNSKRETCMGNPIPFNQFRRLEQRCHAINSLNRKKPSSYSRALFIHVDSRSKSHQTDVFFYHSEKNAASRHLAKTLKSTFSQKYSRHQPGRGFTGTVDQRNLYVLRHTQVVSAFVELGNIQNSFDQRRIILDDNRQALANWMCEAFITDYKYHRKKKSR